jgi:hypothetical protein
MALFTMAMQRSGYVKDKPDRILWQVCRGYGDGYHVVEQHKCAVVYG